METNEARLWRACDEGDLARVQLLTADPAVDVNFVGFERGDTPLIRACRKGHTGIVEHLVAHPRVNVELKNAAGGSPFFLACQENHLDLVRLLGKDPRIDVNALTHLLVTPFSIACEKGHVEVVTELLADPRIDVVKVDESMQSPFQMACGWGNSAIVALLLADPRVDVLQCDHTDFSPFRVACEGNHGDTVSLLLEDDRIDLKSPILGDYTTLAALVDLDSLSIVQRILASGRHVETPFMGEGESATKDLVTNFEDNPDLVRWQLRQLPRFREKYIGQTFALIVLLCDQFFTLTEAESQAQRFFAMARLLPMDLQMVLCNRLYSSPRDIVLRKHSEPGFRRHLHM